MQRFALKGVGVLALALLLAGLVRAQPPTAKPKARPKHHVVHGHQKLTPQKARSIRNGSHLVHRTRHGHQAHAVIKKGKVAGLRVKDKRGKQLAVKVHKQRGTRPQPGKGRLHRVSAGAEDLAGAEVTTAQLGGVFVVFSFVNPLNNQTVFLFFPLSMVSPELGGEPGQEDENLTEV
jgi:hypothetical protein